MLFFEYQIDLETVLEHLKDHLDHKPKLLFSHSMGGSIGLRYLLRDTSFKCSIFAGPLWGLPVSDLTVSILIPVFNLLISMGLGLLTYPYKVDGFNILTKPFEKNILTKNIDTYNEMRENLLIDPRLGLGPPTITWVKALNEELIKVFKDQKILIMAFSDRNINLQQAKFLWNLGVDSIFVDKPI